MCSFFNRFIAALLLLGLSCGSQAQEALKIGVLGAMSGPAKYWGLTNKYCALATAKMYNDQGGIRIGEKQYRIQIISYDTALDTNQAVAGAKQLIRKDGIRYLIGPNIDDTSFAIVPLIEANNVINISYGFNPKLFRTPRENSILGMIHPSTSAPAIYQYLKQEYQIRSVAFLARRDKESINQRNLGIEFAESLGLTVKELGAWDVNEVTYTATHEGLEQLASAYAGLKPDLIVLSGAAPADTSKLIRALRKHNYEGYISTETAQEPEILIQALPELNNFISLGSTPPQAVYSDYMKRFAKEYTEIAGEWHDEAGVKVYALELLLRIMQQAGEAAITDTDIFKTAADSFSIKDPFYEREQALELVDNGSFGQKRQINVPLTIQLIENGQTRSISF